MFGPSYFGTVYFGPVYWPPGAGRILRLGIIALRRGAVAIVGRSRWR